MTGPAVHEAPGACGDHAGAGAASDVCQSIQLPTAQLASAQWAPPSRWGAAGGVVRGRGPPLLSPGTAPAGSSDVQVDFSTQEARVSAEELPPRPDVQVGGGGRPHVLLAGSNRCLQEKWGQVTQRRAGWSPLSPGGMQRMAGVVVGRGGAGVAGCRVTPGWQRFGWHQLQLTTRGAGSLV